MNSNTFTEFRKFPGRMVNILKINGAKGIMVIPDYLLLKIRTGLEFNEYYNFEFEKQDRKFRGAYMNTKHKLHYLGYLNSQKKYYILARNKYLSHLLLENLGIPQAELLYYYNPELAASGNNFGGKPELVRDFILNTQLEDFVIKPVEGTWGKGIMVYKRGIIEGGSLMLQQWDDKLADFSELNWKGKLIIEKKIVQTRQVDEINPSSLNSIRIITALYPDGNVKIFDPKIKFGRNNSCISNSSYNENITGILEIDSGKIVSAIHSMGFRDIFSVKRHPDSGKQIEGIIIDQWGKIKDQVINFQKKIPFIKVIGWDIAVTDQGAVVIEMNDLFDNVGQYISHRGWKNDISDCYNAWQKMK
jgi:hypothetical protein